MDSNQNNAANTLTNTNTAQGTAWQLIGLSPALTDLTVDIGNSLSVGRSDSNDLVLATSQISRQHAKIDRIGDQLYVQDLGSSNGTFVNGERINTRAHALQATDELAFADLLFMVVNDRLDDDQLLGTLQALETVTSPTTTDTQLDAAKQAASVSPAPAIAPVVDIVTTQDFLPKTQPAIPTEQPVSSDPMVETKEVTADTGEVKTASSTSSPSATPVTSSLVTADTPASPQPSIAPVQQAQPSAMSTVTPAQQPAAKKNAWLAMIIVVIITLIIVAMLFR